MPTSLSKKLGIKPGQRILLLNAPATYRQQLEPLPEDVSFEERPAGVYNAVHLFAEDKRTLDTNVGTAVAALDPAGQLWVAFPKGNEKAQQGLTRDIGWDSVEQAGMTGMTLIAVDDRWSAFRFKRKAGATGSDPLAAQYAGPKAALKPIYERVVTIALQLGADVQILPRATYAGLARTRQFAVIQPSTRTRVDLGLRLPGIAPTTRLIAAHGLGSDQITHRVALGQVADVDDEVRGWLLAAYKQVV